MNFYCKELQEVNPLIKQNKNCKLLLRQKPSVFCVFKINFFDFCPRRAESAVLTTRCIWGESAYPALVLLHIEFYKKVGHDPFFPKNS